MATKEQLERLVKWLFEISIYSQTKDIDVYQQSVEAVRIWWSDGEPVMTTPQGEVDARGLPPKPDEVISLFGSLLGGLGSPVRAFAFMEPDKLGLWAIHEDEGLETQIRLAEIYTTLVKRFPAIGIDFVYFSEREFAHVNPPIEAKPVKIGGPS